MMSIFSEHILKLLNDYKRILKRHLSTKEREKTIIDLGLKRKSLKFDTDAILYNKAHRVLKDIEYWTAKYNHAATEYSGIDEFYSHLKKYLNNYRIDSSQIVHMTQQVSCALVKAIQLISLPDAMLCDSHTHKLDDCIQTVVKFGTKDQRIMLAKALHNQKNRTATIFTPALDNFVKNHYEYSPSRDEHF